MKDKSKGRIAKPVPPKPKVQLRKTPAPVVQESAIAVAEPSKEERSALEIDKVGTQQNKATPIQFPEASNYGASTTDESTSATETTKQTSEKGYQFHAGMTAREMLALQFPRPTNYGATRTTNDSTSVTETTKQTSEKGYQFHAGMTAREMLALQFPRPTKNNFNPKEYPPFAPKKKGKEENIHTPKSAAEDPGFIALKTALTSTAKQQSHHESGSAAAQKAQRSAPAPSNERLSSAQANQVAVMEQQEAGEFSAADFKKQLEGKIAEMKLPKNEEQADNFDENNNIAAVNSNALQEVSTVKNNASGAIANSTAAKPNEAAVPQKTAQPLPMPNYGKSLLVSGAKKAMPPKRTNAEVEQPIQEQISSMDTEMAAHGVTDQMLANSNEPSFTNALAEKNAAKAQSAAATENFRGKEATEQQELQNQAQQTTNSEEAGMHATRKMGLQGVQGNQKATATKNSAERKRIADKVNSIYNQTKAKVETLLSSLDTEVANKFIQGTERAKAAFESHVALKMAAYKKERYGDSFFSFKQFRRLKDAFAGLPKEVNEFFVSGRQVYIDTMDRYITDIANTVAQKLNEVKSIIASGKTEVKNYIDGLSPELKKLGKEAASNIEAKFDSLEQTVNDKKDSLIDALAEKYAENLASVDTRIEEMKAANSGLINKALGALKGVFEVIINIKNTLTRLLSKIVAVVVVIITDPIGFFSNLIAGVGQGFKNFAANITKHLQTGFFGWLTGAIQGVSFIMPENIFSLKGIFSVVTQVLGLTWQGIRAIGTKLIGEPVMKVLETGATVVQVVKKEGAAGLWEYLKEQFQDLKSVVMDAIMNLIQTQVIQAGIKWILGLLNPVSAFIKAAMAIVDVVKFFIERAAQIMELVNAFIDSVAAIASGKIGAVAKAIENALGKAIPLLIGLLASILGIGGLANKVMGVIKKIRQRIVKAITAFWKKVKKGARKLLSKFKKGGAKKIKEDNKKATAEKISPKDEAKHKKIAATIKKKLEVKSRNEAKNFKEFYKLKNKQAEQLEDKYQPELKKGINLDIKPVSSVKEQEGNNIVFDIVIYPNDTKEKAEVVYADGEEIKNITLVNELEKLPAKASFADVRKMSPQLRKIAKKHHLNYTFKRMKLSHSPTHHEIEIKEEIKTDAEGKTHKDIGIIKIEREGGNRGKGGGAPDVVEFLSNARVQFNEYSAKMKIVEQADKLHNQLLVVEGDSKIEDLDAYVNKLNDLSVLLAQLSTVEADLPNATYEFDQDGEGKAIRAEAFMLNTKTGPGTPPKAKVIGWDYITGNLNDKNNKLWVRLHLINEKKFGGRGGSTNLLPGTKNNNSDHLYNFEKKLKDWLDTEKDGNFRVAGLKAIVERYGADEFDNEKHHHLRVGINDKLPKSEWYASKITFTAKEFVEKSGKWEKGSKDAVAPLVLNIPLPNFNAINVPALPTITSKQLENIVDQKLSNDKGKNLFKIEAVRNFLKREVFSDHEDLEHKLIEKGESMYGLEEDIIDILPDLMESLIEEKILTF